MEKNLTNKTFIGTMIICVFIFILLPIFQTPVKETIERVVGGAVLSSKLQLATSTSVGMDINVLLFSENNYCSSRVISTTAQAIMLSFDEPSLPSGVNNISSSTLSGTLGFWQSASTTKEYDARFFGCGDVYAYGQVATTTITTAEF